MFAKAALGYGDPRENVFVHADNFVALRWLATNGFENRAKLVYLDPPYNTGRAFSEYTDRATPEAWKERLARTLDRTLPLLASDGVLVAQIDDTEIATLQLLLDERFGREARLSTITLVRSAATGHKAKNRGPVNVTDFLLVYARKGARVHPQSRPRRGYDAAYSQVIENPEDDRGDWRFRSLAGYAANAFGFASVVAAKKAIGSDVFAARKEALAIEQASRVIRFAQPRLEAIGRAAQRLVKASLAKSAPPGCLRLERPGLPDFLVHRGQRVLFLDSKVREADGKRVLVEPLTNVWDDLPYQGISREGGARFVRNKKPERLMKRILDLFTEPADWVLDPFLGSGTTAAVAHKMGRRWIGIEEGEHALTLAHPRLCRVVDGNDPTGITRDVAFAGGGGFRAFSAEK